MPGINVGPSMGFFGRMGQGFKNLGQNAPGVVNALGANFGGPMSGAAKATGQMGRNRPGMGNRGYGIKNPNPQPNPQPNTGMVRLPNISFGGPMRPMPTNGGIMPPGGNTGITGGMFGGGGPLFRPAPAPSMVPDNGGMGAGSLWNTYNSLANQQSGPPNRQLFY